MKGQSPYDEHIFFNNIYGLSFSTKELGKRSDSRRQVILKILRVPSMQRVGYGLKTTLACEVRC